MSEEESSAGNGNSEARMPFYSQLELLTVEDHGALGGHVVLADRKSCTNAK